jgi:hypothetical protein
MTLATADALSAGKQCTGWAVMMSLTRMSPSLYVRHRTPMTIAPSVLRLAPKGGFERVGGNRSAY